MGIQKSRKGELMEYINRAIEDIVKGSANNFKAVLVTGTRQIGKLTLLKYLYLEKKRGMEEVVCVL